MKLRTFKFIVVVEATQQGVDENDASARFRNQFLCDRSTLNPKANERNFYNSDQTFTTLEKADIFSCVEVKE